MLHIIQGKTDAKNPPNWDRKTSTQAESLGVTRLVDEKGHVNEKARHTLIENINISETNINAIQNVLHLCQNILKLLKSLLQQEQPKSSSGYCTGLSFSSTKKAQLFIPEQVFTELTRGFAESFTKALKKNGIKIHTAIKLSELNKDLPLIVACPSGSRLEPSIAHAFEHFRWQVSFITVILNSGTKESLPEVSSAIKLPKKDMYMNAVFTDVAYNNDAKLYDCAMNTTAMDRIKTFVENFQK